MPNVSVLHGMESLEGKRVFHITEANNNAQPCRLPPRSSSLGFQTLKSVMIWLRQATTYNWKPNVSPAELLRPHRARRLSFGYCARPKPTNVQNRYSVRSTELGFLCLRNSRICPWLADEPGPEGSYLWRCTLGDYLSAWALKIWCQETLSRGRIAMFCPRSWSFEASLRVLRRPFAGRMITRDRGLLSQSMIND